MEKEIHPMEHNMPALIPGLSISDAQQTWDFFQKLGFHKLYSMESDKGELQHGHVARGDAHFMIGPRMSQQAIGGGGVTFYVNVGQEDLEAFFHQVEASGVKVDEKPTEQFWGDRTFTVLHPDGYRFTFAKTVREVSLEEMKAAAAKAHAKMANQMAPA
jgi:PhnB protein